ncbi:stage II sporulation protein P [Rossellomorea arthrocnemi]|jgi:stage II sporulation protein P|uniref:stage II sporulation protein P n=1 Tax=Rossellomorea arthrocnemi TaxID=2769542 RepID=UPI001919EEE4|nr:stage II sporulation protein P [Rossellomorea arthrocnemi]
MQGEKEIIQLMKETYPLEPRKDFVSTTQHVLEESARRKSKRRQYKNRALTSIVITLSVIVASWVLFFDGTSTINRNVASLLHDDAFFIGEQEQPAVYVYHSHNKESFIPELSTTKASEAFDDSTNITLVGKRLQQQLNKKGIDVIHEQKDVGEIVDKRNWSFKDSYKVSREQFKEVLKDHQTIEIALDIHRDSRKKAETTLKVENNEYARTIFIVSRSSSNFEENLKFAKLISEQMEEKVPGVSRGVVVKSKENTEEQNTYNQDLLDQSVLLNIGGLENTLEEEYRTINVLADVIEEIMKD